jgi:RhoGEF domain
MSINHGFQSETWISRSCSVAFRTIINFAPYKHETNVFAEDLIGSQRIFLITADQDDISFSRDVRLRLRGGSFKSSKLAATNSKSGLSTTDDDSSSLELTPKRRSFMPESSSPASSPNPRRSMQYDESKLSSLLSGGTIRRTSLSGDGKPSSPAPLRSVRGVPEEDVTPKHEKISKEQSAEFAAKRFSAVERLVSSEKEYVAMLATLTGVFLKPLIYQKLLNPKQIGVVFANLEQIETTHVEFLAQLELLEDISASSKVSHTLRNMVLLDNNRLIDCFAMFLFTLTNRYQNKLPQSSQKVKPSSL